MLVLTRRMGEATIIDDEIEITVLNIQRNQVRLGIKAPQQVSVHREEIYRKLQAEQPQTKHVVIELSRAANQN